MYDYTCIETTRNAELGTCTCIQVKNKTCKRKKNLDGVDLHYTYHWTWNIV